MLYIGIMGPLKELMKAVLIRGAGSIRSEEKNEDPRSCMLLRIKRHGGRF